MLGQQVPQADVDAVQAGITVMWGQGPGSWVRQWSELAERAGAAGDHLLAAQEFGWAHFPALADQTKRAALSRQLDQYLAAAPDFPVGFQRIHLPVGTGSGTVEVPVHVFAAPGLDGSAPVVLFSGGVDSWKMDLHHMAVGLARRLPVRLLAFDIPGTGENPVPMSRASTGMIDGLVGAARAMTSGPVAHVGVSMGGYFSAYSGLSGLVDASVSFGGPVEAAFTAGRGWQHGMAGILGNAFGFDHEPDPAEFADHFTAMSLHDLVGAGRGTPVLAIDGDQDVHVPIDDTLLFADRPGCTARLLPGTGHCAPSKQRQAWGEITGWLSGQLTGNR